MSHEHKTSDMKSHAKGSCARWLWRFVGLFDVRLRRGLAGMQVPLWKSWDDEDIERWETVWVTAGRAHTPRSEQTGEPRFYIWRYDGRKRFRLWLTNRISISAGRDYEDFEPNTKDEPRAE